MSDSSEPPRSNSRPRRGRLLGIDYGTKRVGLALSNLEQTLATPLETYTRRDERQDARLLQQRNNDYTVAACRTSNCGATTRRFSMPWGPTVSPIRLRRGISAGGSASTTCACCVKPSTKHASTSGRASPPGSSTGPRSTSTARWCRPAARRSKV
ncbi:MAG: Holliday junction resolvase RuvX [Planctomycetaceae bacterium]|nr:Holliday junction resolvase RuvX [Planctomycetaceae bacterium]